MASLSPLSSLSSLSPSEMDIDSPLPPASVPPNLAGPNQDVVMSNTQASAAVQAAVSDYAGGAPQPKTADGAAQPAAQRKIADESPLLRPPNPSNGAPAASASGQDGAPATSASGQGGAAATSAAGQGGAAATSAQTANLRQRIHTSISAQADPNRDVYPPDHAKLVADAKNPFGDKKPNVEEVEVGLNKFAGSSSFFAKG